MNLPPYASLIARKLIVRSSKNPFIAVDEHFAAELLMVSLEKIQVDDAWYLANNLDVVAAIDRGSVKSAKYHYCRYGYKHRMPHRIIFDEPWYLSEYPDVRSSVLEAKDFASGQYHFERVGYTEGRYPYRGFLLRSIDT